MTTFFISRHPGALDWAAGEGLVLDRGVAYLNPATLQPGDVVIDT